MKPQHLNDPFHNPFYNRFNDPVRRRQDDMQSHEYTMWLSERNRTLSLPMPVIQRNVKSGTNGSEEEHPTKTLTSMLVLFMVFLISAADLLKSW